MQTQAVIGGPQGGLLISPDRPISPQDAGMQAAMEQMRGRAYSPQQAQAITGRASRAAQLAGRYGGLAAMLGAGVKNLYDQTASGEPLSMSGLGSSMYGAQQFAKPLATRGGASLGARVGVRQTGTPQGEMADYTQGAAPEGQKPFRIRDGFDSSMFTPAQPNRPADYAQGALAQPFNMPQGTNMSMFDRPANFRYQNPAQQRRTEFMRNTPEARRIRSERSQQTFPVQVPLMGKVFDMAPPTPTPSMGEDSSVALQSALPDPAEQQAKQMEEQKERQEKQQEMQQEDQRKLAEEMRDRQNQQSTGV